MKKQDYILIAGILLIGVALFIGYQILYHTPGDKVQITIDGKLYQTLPLNQDAVVEIPTTEGGNNILTIEDGYADMTEANCPDGLCVNQKKISHEGETIVCLPHKIVVKIIDGDNTEDDAPDSIAY